MDHNPSTTLMRPVRFPEKAAALRRFFASHGVQAVALMVGTIVGVGIFALPFAVAQAGFFVGIGFLAGLTALVLVWHWIYGEITLRTQESLHLIGYGERYLGRWAKNLLAGVHIFGVTGGLLAYIAISGEFGESVTRFAAGDAGDGTAALWSILFFAVASVLVFLGIRRVAISEVVMVIMFLAIAAAIIAVSVGDLQWSNLTGWNPARWLLPYGIVFAALAGDMAIPEMREILRSGGEMRLMRRSIAVGTLIPVVLSGLFVLVVVGVTGAGTTVEPFRGLAAVLGNEITLLGAVFGFLAVLTSYLVFAVNTVEALQESYRLPHAVAWSVVSLPPLALFLAGLRDFVAIVEVLGVVIAAVVGVMTVAIWWRARRDGDRVPEYQLDRPYLVGVLVAGVFVAAFILRFFVYGA